MPNKKRRSKDTAKKQRNIEHDKDQHRITTTTEETKLLSKARTKVESSLIARNIVAIVFVALLSIGVHHYYQRYDHHHSSHDHDHHDHHQPVSDKNDVDKHKEERKRKGNDDSTASTQTSIKKQTVFLNKDSYEGKDNTMMQ
jgi:cytoskeletal protein RodZ